MIYLEHNDEKCDRFGLRYILTAECAFLRCQAVIDEVKTGVSRLLTGDNNR